MENPGEHLVGQYLKEIKNCDFVEYNLRTKSEQGEIDVIGIDSNNKKVFVCEVAIHLETGLQYTKENRPNNVDKLVAKFSTDIEYAQKNFSSYERLYMLWTPIIKIPKKAGGHSQLKDIEDIQNQIKQKFEIEIELIYNEQFLFRINELREVARKTTQEMSSPIMRFLQIEEKLVQTC
jgi:hypothetical protein